MPLTLLELKNLPKINLHEHLDCSVRPSTLLELWNKKEVQKSKFPFPQNMYSDPIKYQSWLKQHVNQSLAHYLEGIVHHVLPIMQKAEWIERITRENILDAAADGVIGLELRFAPQLHTEEGLSLDTIIESVIKGLEHSPIQVNLIICCLRHETLEVMQNILEVSLKYPDYIKGFDLAGDEDRFPGVLKEWKQVACQAQNAGLRLTIHLGETNHITSKDLQDLKDLNIIRLGHGVRGDYPTHFTSEICPTSNIITRQWSEFKDHPLHNYYQKGHKITINSDGTLFTGIQLSDEYFFLQKYFDWRIKDFFQVNKTAIEASFFDENTKYELLKILKEKFFKFDFISN